MLEQNIFISMNNLSPDHLRPYHLTLSAILSTNLAEQTFSQIIDRQPLCSVYFKYASAHRPDIRSHTTLCTTSVETWRAFRQQFDLDSLKLDTKLVQRYQNSKMGSKEFKLLLLEIVAVSVHNIGVFLYNNLNQSNHDREEALKAPLPDLIGRELKPLPTDFYHPEYIDWEQYPDGVADMVGYWVEYQLFGGVILFNRDQNTDCFVHPSDPMELYGRLIYQISEAQIQQFFDFAENEPENQIQPLSSPFLFKPEKGTRRIQTEDSGALHIYRNKYDRTTRPPGRHCLMKLVPGELEALQESYDKLRAERGL